MSKSKQQIIKDQESIGNIQITREEWMDGHRGDLFMYLDGECLYFKPKPEEKRVFENENFRIEIFPYGIEIYDKNEAQNIEINVSIQLLLEAIKEAERQGLWK